MLQPTASAALRASFVAVLFASSTWAQSTRPANAIERIRVQTDQGDQAHFGRGLLGRVFGSVDDARARLAEDSGVDVRGRWAPIYQASNGEETLSDGLDIYARWDGLLDTSWGKGSLDFHFQRRKDNVLDLGAFDFASELGMEMLATSGDDAGDYNSIAQLSWEQLLLDGDVNVTFGQLDPTNLFDQNEFGGNDRESFLAEPFSTNPVRSTFLPGLGLGAWYHPTKDWYVGGAVITADANRKAIDTDAVEGRWSRYVEAALTPDLVEMGKGNYRVSYQSVDSGDAGRHSTSWALSVDQEMGERHGIFARWAYGDGRRRRFDQMISGGIVIDEFFGSALDRVGIGLFWSSPSTSTLRQEWGFETFWRVQLTERVDLTPDLLLMVPSDKDEDLRAVLGLRLGVNL